MNRFKIHIILSIAANIMGCGPITSQAANVETVLAQNGIQENRAPNPDGIRHFMDGQLLMNQGDFAMAIIEFQQALSLDPNVGAIHTAMAECYWNLGKNELAEQQLIKALNADPKDEDALQMYADQLILQKRYDDAKLRYQTLHKLNPDNPRYLIALAELEKVEQNYSEAMNLYLKAYDLEPDRFDLLERAGRFAITIENIEKATKIFKDLSLANPTEQRYLNLFVDLASRSNNFDEGESHIQKLNEMHGDSPERNAQLGLLLYRKGDKKQARSLLESAIEKRPENSNYYFSLFDIYMDNDEIEKAAKIGDKLIINFPEDWRGYYSRSVVLMEQKNPAAVIDLLGPVSESFQKVFSIQYLLGLNHNQLKEYGIAEKYFNNALNIRPKSKNVLHSLAILYDEIDEFEKSDKIYIELIHSDSTDAQAYNNFAYSLVERNITLDRALKFAKKAIALEPENPSYLDTIGWIYFKQNKLDQAQSYIEASLNISKNNAVVLEHLGDVLLKANQPENALKYYNRALELDKNNQRLKAKVYSE